MVVKCIVRGCKSEWHPGCDVKFHSFPSNPTERNKWLKILELKRPFFEKAKICNLHFKASDYMTTGKRLRQGVAPFYNKFVDSSLIQLNEECSASAASKQHQATILDMPSCSHESWPLYAANKENVNAPSEASKRDWEAMLDMPSCSHDSWPLYAANKENVNAPSEASKRDWEAMLDMPSCSHDSWPPYAANKENVNAPSAASKRDWEAMLDMPSCSHESWPLRDVTQHNVNVPQSKKPRSLLQDILETEKKDMEIGYTSTIKMTVDKSTSPIEHFCADKSVQAKFKSSREEALMIKNKSLALKVFRLNKTLTNLKSLIKIVKSYTENSEIENIITGNFSNICKEFKKKSKKSRVVRYSDEVKAFALTLHFYSAKAYDFLRQYATLPHVETLRRSLASFDCQVGFLYEVLEYLRHQVQLPEKSYLKNVALIFDGMALKQDLSYDQKLDKVFGYVDLGKIAVSDREEIATEALVFQIVSYTTQFKCPIAYFFIKNNLHGELLAELLKTAVALLSEINITVHSLTCDGAPSNLRAYQFLGCSLEEDNFQPHFQHPNGRGKIYCFLDAAHMLKLARNVLAEHEIQSPSGTTSYGFVRKLHSVQREEGFKFGNKLSTTHVEYQNKKMNVKLAAQVLSSSVAESIEFLRLSGNPLFLGSEATVEFLKIIDRIFDFMNSKSPFGRGYKSPMKIENKKYWELILQQTKEYLKSLRINGKSILNHGRKTFALGFLMNIENFPLLFADLLNVPIKYLLTFKCSQDNLEVYFSCIRARGRTNDNPSPLEFRQRLRKLLYRNSVQPSINANCIDHTYEATHVFDYGASTTRSLVEPATPIDDSDDNDDVIENQLQALDSGNTHTDYQKNILYYITGYIVKKNIKRLKCADCKNMLIAVDHSQTDHLYVLNVNRYQSFTTFVNRGKLHFPSAEVFKIVLFADKIFKRASNMNKLNQPNIKNILINLINQHFTPQLRQMFDHPMDDCLSCSEFHESKILKLVSNSFLTMRLRTHLKNCMDEKLSAIRTKRQKLHKTILFSHV